MLKEEFDDGLVEDFCFAVGCGMEKSVRVLLEQGIDPRTVDDNGQPLFLGAVSNGYTKIVDLFLKHGVKPDEFRDRNGRTALAIASINDRNEIAMKLLEAGANPNVLVDDSGYTLMHYVVSSGSTQLTRKMLEKGARVDLEGANGKTPMDYAAPKVRKAIHEYFSLLATKRMLRVVARRMRAKPSF